MFAAKILPCSHNTPKSRKENGIQDLSQLAIMGIIIDL